MELGESIPYAACVLRVGNAEPSVMMPPNDPVVAGAAAGAPNMKGAGDGVAAAAAVLAPNVKGADAAAGGTTEAAGAPNVKDGPAEKPEAGAGTAVTAEVTAGVALAPKEKGTGETDAPAAATTGATGAPNEKAGTDRAAVALGTAVEKAKGADVVLAVAGSAVTSPNDPEEGAPKDKGADEELLVAWVAAEPNPEKPPVAGAIGVVAGAVEGRAPKVIGLLFSSLLGMLKPAKDEDVENEMALGAVAGTAAGAAAGGAVTGAAPKLKPVNPAKAAGAGVAVAGVAEGAPLKENPTLALALVGAEEGAKVMGAEAADTAGVLTAVGVPNENPPDTPPNSDFGGAAGALVGALVDPKVDSQDTHLVLPLSFEVRQEGHLIASDFAAIAHRFTFTGSAVATTELEGTLVGAPDTIADSQDTHLVAPLVLEVRQEGHLTASDAAAMAHRDALAGSVAVGVAAKDTDSGAVPVPSAKPFTDTESVCKKKFG